MQSVNHDGDTRVNVCVVINRFARSPVKLKLKVAFFLTNVGAVKCYRDVKHSSTNTLQLYVNELTAYKQQACQ